MSKRDRTIYRNFRKRALRCEGCGSIFNLTVHHLISQTVLELRLDEENFVCLCRDCHDWVEQTLEGKIWASEHWKDQIAYLVEKKSKLNPLFQSNHKFPSNMIQ